eukprot:PITA_02633
MVNEMASLHEKEAWDIVDLSTGRKPIGRKWVFKKNMNAKGKVEKYNARLVAKCCSQVEQMDVKTTFLHGDLEEEIYMKQLEGFAVKVKKELNGSKGINTNELILSCNLDGFDSSRAELPSEDEDNFKLLRAEFEFAMVIIDKLSIEISRLTVAWKDKEKILHTCDDKEANLREEVISLKNQLEEARRVEDVMSSKKKQKEGQI